MADVDHWLTTDDELHTAVLPPTTQPTIFQIVCLIIPNMEPARKGPPTPMMMTCAIRM